MPNFLDLIRRKAPPPSAELRAALAALPTPATSAADVAKLEGERRAALLDGLVDADVVKIERRIADARREADRAVILREELSARLAQAEQLEAIDALMTRKMAAEAEGRAVAKLFEEFEAHATALLNMVNRSRNVFSEAQAINAEMARLGSTDRVVHTARKTYACEEHVRLYLGITPYKHVS